RAERLDGLEGRPARGDDVLDQTDALALLVDALEPIGGAVLLRPRADDQERQPTCQRRGCGERDRTELGAGEADCIRLVLTHGRRDRRAESAEQVGPRLETVLVEVVARAAAGAQEEVALEVR